MREKWQNQMPLMAHIMDHAQSKELEMISNIIDANSIICQYVLQDLNKGKTQKIRYVIWARGTACLYGGESMCPDIKQNP
jgi:hypothetical protein